MKKLLLILINLFALSGLAQTVPGTCGITWNLRDFCSEPQNVTVFSLQPYPYQSATNGTNIIFPTTAVAVVGPSGQVAISNIVTGFAYKGTFNETDFDGNVKRNIVINYFPTSMNGLSSNAVYFLNYIPPAQADVIPLLSASTNVAIQTNYSGGVIVSYSIASGTNAGGSSVAAGTSITVISNTVSVNTNVPLIFGPSVGPVGNGLGLTNVGVVPTNQIYIDPNGADTNTGLSPLYPLLNIGTALTAATAIVNATGGYVQINVGAGTNLIPNNQFQVVTSNITINGAGEYLTYFYSASDPFYFEANGNNIAFQNFSIAAPLITNSSTGTSPFRVLSGTNLNWLNISSTTNCFRFVNDEALPDVTSISTGTFRNCWIAAYQYGIDQAFKQLATNSVYSFIGCTFQVVTSPAYATNLPAQSLPTNYDIAGIWVHNSGCIVQHCTFLMSNSSGGNCYPILVGGNYNDATPFATVDDNVYECGESSTNQGGIFLYSFGGGLPSLNITGAFNPTNVLQSVTFFAINGVANAVANGPTNYDIAQFSGLGATPLSAPSLVGIATNNTSGNAATATLASNLVTSSVVTNLEGLSATGVAGLLAEEVSGGSTSSTSFPFMVGRSSGAISNTMIATGGFIFITNQTSLPTALPTYGTLWNSNGVLYFVTTNGAAIALGNSTTSSNGSITISPSVSPTGATNYDLTVFSSPNSATTQTASNLFASVTVTNVTAWSGTGGPGLLAEYVSGGATSSTTIPFVWGRSSGAISNGMLATGGYIYLTNNSSAPGGPAVYGGIWVSNNGDLMYTWNGVNYKVAGP